MFSFSFFLLVLDICVCVCIFFFLAWMMHPKYIYTIGAMILCARGMSASVSVSEVVR